MTPAAQYGVHPARVIRRLPGARFVRRPRLGANAQAIVGEAGTLATSITAAGTSSAITSALPFMATLGPAAPFVAIGAVVATLLAQYVGKGCGSACVDASKAEQIYEAGTDNVWAVYKAGMISKAQFLQAAQTFLQASQQHLAQFGTKQAQKGAQNAANVIGAMISGAAGYVDPAPAPLDLNRAQSLYVMGGGWYPDSLAAAAQLATAFLQSLPAPASAAMTAGGAILSTAATGSPAGAIASILGGTLFGIPTWLLAGAGLLFLLMRD